MKEYDILNGGLDLLQKDLDNYIKELPRLNSEFVSKLSELGKNDIILNASLAEESEQRSVIQLETQVVQGIRSGSESSDTIVNNNPKSVFAEFGYGIVGKQSPYSYSNIFNMESAGWEGYDLDSKFKREDRSWYYKGQLTKGATPRNIFYNAYSKIEQSINEVGNQVFNKWSK